LEHAFSMETARKMKKVKEAQKPKICSRCGLENNFNAQECTECHSSRFEPDWVLAKGPVNRQTSVQVTMSNPAYGEAKSRVTLSKWWQGGRATFHIPTPGQWEEIKRIIDTKMLPILGWETAKEMVDKISKSYSEDKKTAVNNLITEHPQILKEIVTHIDPKKLSANDFESLSETLGQISDVVTNANAGFRDAFLSVIKKLPSQQQRALEDLDLLLKGWNLNVITNVAQQVRSRLDTIKLLEERINDPRTLEITGDNSIHRILERSMWLVDERYWLLHSNQTLRKIIGEKMSKINKKAYGKKRPDFVCGTVGERLVILELKRPSHELTVDDLNQLETYIAIAEKHFKFNTFSAYLVGKSVSEDLKQRLKYRTDRFSVLYYSNILDDTSKRYQEFLGTI
jgi:hypothetical protein